MKKTWIALFLALCMLTTLTAASACCAEPSDMDKTQTMEETCPCMMDGKVTVYSMAEYMGLKPDTVRRRLKADGGFWIDGADIGRKEPGSAG